MKKLYVLILLLFVTVGLFSQSGTVNLKYPTVVPSLRVGGLTKLRLDSITQNVDTIKFWNSGSELIANGSGIWTGTGIRLDTTLAKVTLGIDQVTNESKVAMFNDPIFTGVTYFGHSVVPTTPGTGYLGTSTSPVAGLYLGATSPLSWGNSIFLQGGTGQISLSGGNLNLGVNNLLGSGSIGLLGSRIGSGFFTNLTVTNAIAGSITGNAATVSNYTPAGGSITLSGADAITFNTTGASSLTLPTSGTLLTTAVLSGYAPLDAPNFINDMTVEYIRPVTEGGANLGNPSYGWNAVYLDTTGIIGWGATNDILLGNAAGNLRLENSAFLIDNNDIGLNIYPVRKGYFTDLDIVNLPTVGGVTLMTNPMTTAGDLIVGGVSGVPSRLAAGITGTEEYSTENYGATGTGDIVLSTGPTLTTVSITDVIKLTPTALPPAGATEGMIYADTDHHLYYYNGTTWISMTD